MNNSLPYHWGANSPFEFNISEFSARAVALFQFQYNHNEIYHKFCKSLNVPVEYIKEINQIPFLPISFFKTETVTTTSFQPDIYFESSGTTQTINSRHWIKDPTVYEASYNKAFRQFYGDPADLCIIGLLPAYLERQHSSLVVMTKGLIDQSKHPLSGFYLYEYEKLAQVLQQLEQQGQRTLLLGVTFALLDFAEQYPMALKHTMVMETGGMKGRKKEMIRAEVQDVLKKAFQLDTIHSEYGMTELLSQAYSAQRGIFNTPPWMKIVLRSEDDPFEILLPEKHTQRGVINVIDLANLYSCAFIATDDAGILYADGSFEVLGRVDNSDIRGCSLMAL